MCKNCANILLPEVRALPYVRKGKIRMYLKVKRGIIVMCFPCMVQETCENEIGDEDLERENTYIVHIFGL